MNTDHDRMQGDPAPQLATLEALAAYLAAAFESGDAAILTEAFAQAAHAEGTAQLAAAAGLPQAELRQAFASGEMSMSTTLAIMKVIDLHMPGAAH
jgi:probable addiction module antidote protein